MNLSARVAQRYLTLGGFSRRALILPPRRILVFLKALEKDTKKGLIQLMALATELAEKANWQSLKEEVLAKVGLPTWSKIREALNRHQNDLDSAFHYLNQLAPKNPHMLDRFARPLVEAVANVLDKDQYKYGATLRGLGTALTNLDRFAWNEMDEVGLMPEPLKILEEFAEETRKLVMFLDGKLAQLEAFETGDAKPGKVETLYHASVKAREIYQRGFSAEMPKDQIGLGGSQSLKSGGNGISFTYDLKAALDIARSFKEAALIATGQIKASQILDWGLREGNIEEFLLWLGSQAKKQYQDLTHNGRRWVLTVKAIGHASEERDIDEVLSDPIDVFNVYDAFLYVQTSRLNPVHMNRHKLIAYLKDADPKDIGVVSVEVDMEYPGISLHGGEREYRVPPAAIRQVLKFYS
jgi:hypothetical protein